MGHLGFFDSDSLPLRGVDDSSVSQAEIESRLRERIGFHLDYGCNLLHIYVPLLPAQLVKQGEQLHREGTQLQQDARNSPGTACRAVLQGAVQWLFQVASFFRLIQRVAPVVWQASGVEASGYVPLPSGSSPVPPHQHPEIVEELEKLNAAIDRLEQGQQSLQENQQRMQENQQRMQESQQRMQESQQRMQESQQRMQKDVEDLQQGQQRLEKDVHGLQEGQQRLENEMQNLQANQQIMQRDLQGLHDKIDVRVNAEDLENKVVNLCYRQLYSTLKPLYKDLDLTIREIWRDRDQHDFPKWETFRQSLNLPDTLEEYVRRMDCVFEVTLPGHMSRPGLLLVAEATSTLDADHIEKTVSARRELANAGHIVLALLGYCHASADLLRQAHAEGLALFVIQPAVQHLEYQEYPSAPSLAERILKHVREFQ